jgi:hypothetical protein
LKQKVGILFIIIFVIGIAIVLFLGPKYHEEQLKTTLANSSLVDTNEEELPDNPDFYQKLKFAQPIQMLVIGDEIASGEWITNEEQKWHSLFSSSIAELYDSEVQIDFLSKTNKDIFQARVNYELERGDAYDLIVIMLGEDDDPRVHEEFPYLYESLIRDIVVDYPKAEIITVIEHDMNEETANFIREIASHYVISVVDARQSLNQSNVAIEELTVDGHLLNEKGNELFSEQLFNVIRTYAYGNKTIKYDVKDHLYEKSQKYDNLELTPLVLGENGVSLGFTGSLVGFTYETGKDHGIVDIYVDGEYLESFDTYDEQEQVQHYLLENQLEGEEHAITFQPSIIENEKAEGTTLEITHLITD